MRAGAAESLGVRLVSIDRPGLGVSTPLPGRTFADLVTDLDVFTHARGFPRPPVLANSQGGPFALARAAETIASGADKIASPRWSIWRVPIPREPKPCSGSSTPRRCGGW
ncbi:alpha/beta fold hydrolase [Prauserella sp. PE36]|uniref:alpha/beta fold hydrolase n=1 Tax=Prauserella sp. PE36 TaxID=1504709 RepID=UPI001F3214CB|nr:alpha/beta hydrolase [Prauserella sp. PE36]